MVNPHLVLRTSLRQGDGCAVDYLDFRGGIQFNIDGRQQITHFNVYVYIYMRTNKKQTPKTRLEYLGWSIVNTSSYIIRRSYIN